MAALDNLIEQIDDPALKKRIQEELKRTTSKRKFGLVYEEHLPECTPLYNTRIRKGSTVAVVNEGYDVLYTVVKIDGNNAFCVDRKTKEQRYCSLDELIAVARFGDPIYPYLEKIDQIENAPDDDTWNALIEADNYHALQLLQYLYPHKVDCIYIDPPYNTGARDWKYNNDYVDGNDVYRHSKWLSFMEKRLKLAKELLNPKKSVLICTIDEKEYLHLGMLLEQIFPDAHIQMISSVISPQGQSRDHAFYRTDEYLFFVGIGDAAPEALELNDEWFAGNTNQNNQVMKLGWDSLKRRGTGAYRADSPNLFYPIYVTEDGKHIVDIGEPLKLGISRDSVKQKEGCKTIWPLRSDGSEGRWQLSPEKLRQKLNKGYVKLGRFDKYGSMAISYLKRNEQNKVENGVFQIIGHAEDGSIITNEVAGTQKKVCGTQWRIASHNAGVYGSGEIREIFSDKRFTFPKSVYAVHDALKFYVANNKNALILDFFAGSGTTLEAVNLLNAEDDGHRRCIMVTNNEVSEKEAKSLKADGYKPGDPEWEKYGIARYVTWPRTVCTIKGVDINGKKLEGDYGTYHDEYVPAPDKKGFYKKNTHVPDDSSLSEIKKSDGFKSNVIYFKLGFLDKNAVSLGRQFAELLPLLWMKAGAYGQCPTVSKENIPPMLILSENRMAILVDDTQYALFMQRLNQSNNIQTVYLVTDSDDNYRDMIKALKDKTTYQLYRDYLDNFKVNGGTY